MATNVVRYHCPCCGFNGLACPPYAQLGSPPWPRLGDPPYATRLGSPSYEVCPCCGFEYGFDDDPGASTSPSSFEDYRADWLFSGALWFSPEARQDGWDLRNQLASIGVVLAA